MINRGTWKKGICGVCPAGCWVEVKLDRQKIVDIRPDDTHQLGMLCRRGKHAAEIVYSKHRLKYPMKRIGKKGNYRFTRISWDEAYATITDNLLRLKEESGPESISIYTGRGAFELSLCDMFQPKEAVVSSASNILFPFGSPNTMGVGALCYVSFAMIAPDITFGSMLVDMFTDMENAEMLIVWGANPATDSPPMDMVRLEKAAHRGCRIVVIDPRYTETAKRTNAEWIAIRPGTDGALALAIIKIIIDEDLHDEGFVDNWTHGFRELESYVQHFTAELAERITGVPQAKIYMLARQIAASNGAAPVMYTGLEYSNSGIQAIRSVLILFAICGHLDTPGGIGLARSNHHFPINRACNQSNPAIKNAVAYNKFPLYSKYRGESHASGLIDAVLDHDPYPIRGLIIHGASILTSWPETAVWKETLSKLDFVVSIDRQLTADSAYADIVLPATTMFEIDSYMVYGSLFRLREKLIEPVGEARNDYLIMANLAEKLGYGHIYPQTEDELIRFALEGSGFTLEEILANGGIAEIPSSPLEYRKYEKGRLRPDGKPGFATPTGKLEIWSTILEEYDYEPLPKYTEPREGPLVSPELNKTYPLVLNTGARPDTDFRSQHHGIEGLSKTAPEPEVLLNSHDARERGISDGDLVEIRSPRGSVQFRARVNENIIRGAVEANMGGGTPVGPDAWNKNNVNELTDLSNFDSISGFPVFKALLCEVVKVASGQQRASAAVASMETYSGATNVSSSNEPYRNGRKVYLDNNATTQVAKTVREAMIPFLSGQYGNPSSIHSTGRSAKQAIQESRRHVANLLGTKPGRIVFTSGGSEANNTILKGIAASLDNQGKHIITSRIEHPSILATVKHLENRGYRITCLDVDNDGLVDIDHLARALTHDTILVSVMTANNEVGTIQPIRELVEITHANGSLFHTDAVQAAGKIPLNVEETNVDLLSLSGHKFHGPKGVGAMYIRKGIDLEPLVHGGQQESGIRAGTENVSAIAGLGKAAEQAIRNIDNIGSLSKLRDMLERGIKDIIPDARLTGHRSRRLANTLNMITPGYRGESLVIALDRYGISFSSGSACKSGSPEPTHVLLAMGYSREDAHCSVRFSLDSGTTREDIEYTLQSLEHVVDELRTTIRFLPCK